MRLSFIKTLLATIALSITSMANAGLITGELNVDNQHWVYLSTDDNVQGDLISSGDDWRATDTFTADLTAGTDYFLHIHAQDLGVIAGFLGNFTLEGDDHLFSNGLTELLTNINDWSVSTQGWGDYEATHMVNGTNGVAPWGRRTAIDSDATWIWTSDAINDRNVYFSTAISIADTTINAVDVPEPSTVVIFALAIAGLIVGRLRKQS